jgi:hypothetical protein
MMIDVVYRVFDLKRIETCRTVEPTKVTGIQTNDYEGVRVRQRIKASRYR